jgi:hypothetical protein
MNESPYIFSRLAATRGCIPDPLVEIDGWLSQLQDLLEPGPEVADEAYDLLALWAKMRRVRPELTAQLGGADALARADVLLTDRGARLAAEALTIPNPQGWINDTQCLAKAYDEPGTSAARSELAERLLTDLDDAELVLHASRRFGVDDRELETDLALCHEWLTEHVELFLAASVHVQAVGMAFRPDLTEFDYALAVTALKYLDVLQAAETAEEELSLAGVQQLDAAIARRVAAKLKQQRDLPVVAKAAFLSVIAVTLRSRLQRAVWARAGTATVREPLWWWEWRAPVGDLLARLTIPPQPVPDQQVFVEFVGPDRQRATELAGQAVTLHGVESTIDPRAKAAFPLARLLETNEPLVLRVGPTRDEWILSAAHADT